MTGPGNNEPVTARGEGLRPVPAGTVSVLKTNELIKRGERGEGGEGGEGGQGGERGERGERVENERKPWAERDRHTDKKTDGERQTVTQADA